MNHSNSIQTHLCAVGDTMYYPKRVGDQIVIGDDAKVTQIPAAGEGFCFQFQREIDANYEVHHFLAWSSVGTLAFFIRKEAEAYIASLPPCEPFTSVQCNKCFAGIYQECGVCGHVKRGDSTC